MPKKKTAPKKTSAKKEIFSTQINFIILALFCLFIAILFRSIYGPSFQG
jgi:hypothetical protein